jgi:N-succinyldiaminopimelate aminotransferase
MADTSSATAPAASSRDYSAHRVRGGGTTIFAEITALAIEHDAVNLGQGAPDFDTPDLVREAAHRAIEAGRNQYATSSGEAALRGAIAAHAMRFYGQELDVAREITVTTGATEALFCAAMAFVDPGDEVIVFEPTYDSYVPGIRMAGGTPVAVPLHAPAFRFDPEELRRAFSPRTRMIYVNTPHNPTGTVFNDEELALIAELCIEHDVVAVTDEVYEHIVFDGARHRRLATMPGMRERTLTISSAGKTFSATGWKIGWTLGPEPLQRAIRGIHQWTTFATSTPMQHAMAEALAFPDAYYDELRDDYQRRRDFLLDALRQTPLAVTAPEGSYFVLADIGSTARPDAATFARWMASDVGVAVIPCGSFYLNSDEGRRFVRFCFCKRWETLDDAARRLRATGW